MSLANAACAVGVERGDSGSTIFRHTEVLERVSPDRGQEWRSRRARDEVVEDLGIGVGAGDQRLQAADRFAQFKRIEIVLDAQHRRRVDRLALEDAFDQLAARGQAEDLRQRPGRRVALQPLDGARRQDQHAVRALAAQHLLPGEGDDIELREVELLREGGRGRVADGQALAVGRDAVARSARARRRSCRSR